MYTYNIFDEALHLRDFVNNFFNDSTIRAKRAEFPHIAFYEGEDEIEIKAVVPGIKSEDLNIQLIDNSLIIEGEKKSDYEDSPYIRKERLFGKFKKSVKLPYKVDSNKIKADLKDGILKISLTKSEDAKPKKITIN